MVPSGSRCLASIGYADLHARGRADVSAWAGRVQGAEVISLGRWPALINWRDTAGWNSTRSMRLHPVDGF